VNYARNGKQRGRDPGRDLAQRQNGSDLNLSGCRELGLQRRSSPMGASAADWGLKKKEKPEAFHFLWLFGVSVVGVLFPTGDTNRQGLLPPSGIALLSSLKQCSISSITRSENIFG
jgi:hypothetical protein